MQSIHLEARRSRYFLYIIINSFIRLRDLLRQDEEQYRHELACKEETRESRIDAMRARMNELKAEREKERKAIVDKKLMQRWR